MSEPVVRVLPAPPGGRVETGPTRFGDDWTGTFVRGDDAFRWLTALRHVLVAVTDPFDAAVLFGIVDELASCVEGKFGEDVRAEVATWRK